jgi:hypothetical protein
VLGPQVEHNQGKVNSSICVCNLARDRQDSWTRKGAGSSISTGSYITGHTKRGLILAEVQGIFPTLIYKKISKYCGFESNQSPVQSNPICKGTISNETVSVSDSDPGPISNTRLQYRRLQIFHCRLAEHKISCHESETSLRKVLTCVQVCSPEWVRRHVWLRGDMYAVM